MMSGCVRFAFVSGLLAGTVPVHAQEVAALPPSAQRAPQFMRVYGNAQPPYGFLRMCERDPRECGAYAGTEVRFSATPERLSELDEINREVNERIEPATDQEIYGINEYWTVPTARGDCEDYALLKRHELLARGWPANALLITVVRDEKNEGHAVLTARTSQGDFILDNKIEVVRLWNQTPYHYVMRQSYIDPKVWVSLDQSDSSTPAAIAGVQASP